MKRAIRYWLLAGSLLLLVGCSGEPFSMIEASGKITYEDGTPLPLKKGDVLGLIFLPQTPPLDPATHPRMGTATVNPEDGTFDSATTHKYGDGLIRCKYKVSLYTGDNFSPAIPREYQDPETTPLEVDASEQPMHLKIPRPR